jgi:membrane fusion protein (multidrug efflux system)
MSRLLWPGLILSVAMLAACAQDGPAEGDADVQEDSEEEEEKPAIPVEVGQATRGDIYSTYSGTAPIEAFEDAEVIAKVGGEIQEILVEEGDDVVSGQLLARLDGDRLRLEVAQSDANLQKLKRDFQRNIDLKEKGLISTGDFEKLQYETEAVEAGHNLAKLELSYTEIRAPINGVISERFVKIGNTIEANIPMFQVTSLEPLVSYLHVPEREYRRLESGQVVTIKIDALQGTEFSGVVARVSPVVDPETGTFKITIEVSDQTRRLKPGMFGRIGIVSDMHANALRVPRSAIIEEAGESSLYVVEDELANKRIITTGFAEDGQVEILDGLTDDEVFVTVGQAGLKDGAKISVIGAPATPQSANSSNPSSNP